MDSKIKELTEIIQDYRRQVLWDVITNVPGLHVENYGLPSNGYLVCWWECCSDAKHIINYNPAIGLTAADIQTMLTSLIQGSKNTVFDVEKLKF